MKGEGQRQVKGESRDRAVYVAGKRELSEDSYRDRAMKRRPQGWSRGRVKGQG